MHEEKEGPELIADETAEEEVIIDGDELLRELEPAGEEEPVAVDLNAEVERLTAELAAQRDLYLRKLAEFDNFRKRTEREREELERFATGALTSDLLPVLDNFERAVEHGTDTDLRAYHRGVEMIAKQLWDVLERRGLERIDPAGQQFQPEYHEAVQRIEGSEHEPGTVVAVMARGYRMGGKLLRPALVAVAIAPADPVRSESPAAADGGEAEGAS